MSQITTHVLDTSQGIPAAGIVVNLLKLVDNQWNEISSSSTSRDGRISDFLSSGKLLNPGRYRLDFKLEQYFSDQGIPCFYPEASVIFIVSSSDHYHIPLLLSPFGYSTYRGS